jgi:uncharacterized protein (TIGR00730 family)
MVGPQEREREIEASPGLEDSLQLPDRGQGVGNVLADGFIALPGGFGTLEELLEMVTWAQLGLHAKPVGLLAVGGYFAALLALIERAVTEGFVVPENRRLLVVASEVGLLLDRMRVYEPPRGFRRWIGPEET